MAAPERELADFAARLRALDRSDAGPLRGFFAADRPVAIARAPGRLDVMGGIADYSGSLVLQLPIAEGTFAAVQQSGDDSVRVVSLPQDDRSESLEFALSCRELQRLAADGYRAAAAFFARDPQQRWAAYPLGTLLVLLRERGAACTGLRIAIASRVPAGKGVSSSAALEVATMQALAATLGIALAGEELATLCQLAENRVVGAPCGIMDQMTAALGQQDRLLALLCQPASLQGFLPIPGAIRFFGIDSGVRHAVAGADYGSVRTGAFLGYRILADLAGLRVAGEHDGALHIDDPRWHGCLANIDPAQFAAEFAARLPERVRGRDFLQRYRGHTDAVTRIDPDRDYAVRLPTAHPIEEHARVRRFAELLPHAADANAAIEMGELMYASHASYSACGLGSPATDRLVALARAAGPRAGIYGARITGGGSGGTVAVLARADAAHVVAEIAREHARRSGGAAQLFAGSSPGACAFGVH